jgi:hypothetical protein
MASLTNNEARLLWGPRIPGFMPPRWLPGKNLLDAEYWSKAKQHGTVARWIALDMIEVDLDEELPDPTVPPSAKELGEFSEKELGAALKNPNVPVQWHPALEGELDKRKAAKVADLSKRLPPKTPPTDEHTAKDRKSLTGLKVEDALPLIAAESDVDTLEAWADADKRKTIDEAIDGRLAELALDEDGG